MRERALRQATSTRIIDVTTEVLRRLSLPETITEIVDDRSAHDFRHFPNCREIHRLESKAHIALQKGVSENNRPTHRPTTRGGALSRIEPKEVATMESSSDPRTVR